MKKSLLIACGFGIALFASAQNKTTQKHIATKPPFILNENSPNAGAPFVKAERKTPKVITNGAVCDLPTGSAGNAYGGFTRPGRAIVDYNDATNTVTLTHRSHPAVDGTANTGHLMFDKSTDGGLTWTINQGPVFEPNAELARYPIGLIVNPMGNTIGDSAYIGVHGACTDGSNWVAYSTGTSKIGVPYPPTCQQADVFNSTVNFGALIPDAGVNANGTLWVSDWTFDGADYTDTLLLRKGTWNTTTKCVVWSTVKVPFPVPVDGAGAKMFVTTNVAFSANGQTGYLTALANSDLTCVPDSTNYIHVWKTTDGGMTWNGPKGFPVTCAAGLLSLTGPMTTAFQVDGAVDMNGDLHLHLGIGPWAGGGSIGTGPGQWGVFSVVTDGATASLELLAKPMTFRGTFGGITEDSRPQIAVSQAGDKVFYVWFDTDTVAFPGGENTNPDAYCRVYDVATGNWEAVTNLTAGTVADGTVTFGYVANWAKGSASPYQVHIGYQAFTATDVDPVNFHYLCGVDVTTGVASAGAPCTPSVCTTPFAITAVSVTTDNTCAGGGLGSATVTAISGGTAPFSYLWAPSGQTTATATGLAAGTYTVVVTDAAAATQMATVTVPSVPLATTSSSTNVTCAGANDGTATASTTAGTPPYTYAWSPSGGNGSTATGLAAGTYTCTITDAGGCAGTAVVVVTAPTAIAVNITATTPASSPTTPDGTANSTATGGTPPYTYAWSTTPVQVTQNATGLMTGTYTVCVTDANGCSVCNSAYVSAVGVNEINASFSIVDAYPNPTHGAAVIEVNMKRADNISIEVSNMIGQVIYTTNARLTAGPHKFTVETGKWNSGVYFYTVKSEEFNVTRKLVCE